ncbi:Hypothetical protein FKW44_012426 [Caligus rogercresseyi]|uniref:Uncharacterized protein n=1 Tax=Caligus rogercresseyi TaxID=217165 RepID=A0A7T8HKI7_CALRO|nr:Hypothetical protein FKW44_012426 [Caligus rogercresseyi]
MVRIVPKRRRRPSSQRPALMHTRSMGPPESRDDSHPLFPPSKTSQEQHQIPSQILLRSQWRISKTCEPTSKQKSRPKWLLKRRIS